ncbi:MAG TPA: glycosyltransferase family 2 protein [Candidatus Saccharimonadales bacterium]|nr:glycosyltransferase family 2 protein [Candidatus Saccharimonadales bacterium]
MNKKQKAYALSIIIPAYNEENYLSDCLESIARQTVGPIDVIVVDNNSTDDTVEIARRFDFVKIKAEKRQHQTYAQHTGFDSASGEIIGRIDADTILPADWAEKVLAQFAKHPDIVAVTGSGVAYDIVLKDFGRYIHRRYFRLANSFAGHALLWGSNCAFRGSFWPKVRNDILLRSDIWEDYDLGFCLAKHGKIQNMIDNDVLISYRSIHKQPIQQLKYHFRSVTTFYLRRGLAVSSMFGLLWSSILLLGPVVAVDYYILRPAKNVSLIRTLRNRLAVLFNA